MESLKDQWHQRALLRDLRFKKYSGETSVSGIQ